MRDGIFFDCNPVSEKLFGASKEHIIGHSPLDFSPEYQADRIRSDKLANQYLKQAYSGEPQRFEWIHRRPDGYTFFAEVSLNRLLYKDEYILQAIVRDISERKQAEAEIRLRTTEIESLYQLSHALADANDLNQVADTITRYSVENTRKTFARIAFLKEDNLVIHSVKSIRRGTHPLNYVDSIPLSYVPICRSVLEGNDAKIITSGEKEVNPEEREFLLLDHIHSLYLVPLRAGLSGSNYSPPLGILMVGEARSEDREPPTDRMTQKIQSVADQASSAIRRILLREETDRHLQFLNSLDEIDRAITSSFDMNTSLKIVLSTIRKQLNVDAANILILNPSSRYLENFISDGFRTHAIDQTRLRIGESHAGKAAFTQKIIHIADLKDPKNYLKTLFLADENFIEYFGIPLITKGQVKGVLEIFNRTLAKTNEVWLGNLNTLAERAAIAIENSMMFQDVTRTNIDLTLAYDQTIEGWSNALDLRDHETEGHSLRVAENSIELANACGYPKEDLMQFRWGALLHDIGKMGIPDSILLKPGPLTDEEWLQMKEHPSLAYKMLSRIQYLRLALDIPYCHHEKWDGTGYPRGLKGEQIPLAARIFSVVDVWDALTSDRTYRPAWTEEQVLRYIQEQAGSYFDPQIVKKFLNIRSLGRINQRIGRST
jgi:PAS domain S-box-containing protein/putative nucleotidyltransferase with HDIG domain